MTEHEQQDERQFAVHRIYTKDLSYEAPNVPELFRQDGQPKHKIDLNTSADKIDDETFEVILSVTVTTQVADKTAWLVEVQLAGLFGARGFPEKELPHLLGAYCPNLLFPYVGEVVSNLVTRGLPTLHAATGQFRCPVRPASAANGRARRAHRGRYWSDPH